MKKVIVLVWAVCLLAACASQETGSNRMAMSASQETKADKIAALMLENGKNGGTVDDFYKKLESLKKPQKEKPIKAVETETDLRSLVRDYGTHQYTDPLTLAILKSDVEGVKQALVDRKNNGGKEISERDISRAVGICEPYRQADKFEPFKVECDETKDPDVKKKNAEIIGLLIQNSNVDVDQLRLTRLDGRTRYVALTLAGMAKEYNPLAVKYFLPKMDKCLAALSQMQNADDSKPNYYVYADFWRNHNCSVPEELFKRIGGSEKMQTLFKLIGKDKQAVEEAFGKNPTVYEHPSEFREVLTYKRVETWEGGGTVAGAKGSFTTYYTDAHDYVFTLDRGVVTNVQDIMTSRTRDGETKTQTLEDIKQKDLEDRQNKAGHVVNRRGVIIK